MKRSRSCGRRAPPIIAAEKTASRWHAVSSASSIGGCTASEATAAPAPTATCRATASSFRRPSAEARFQLLQWRRTLESARAGSAVPADRRRRFPHQRRAASDFSNLRQNGLVRVTLPLPPNIRLIDPATNAPSTETIVDVWRAVPSVNDVKLTGPDGAIPWPRGPNTTGGYQLDGRKATLQEQALGAFESRADRKRAAAAAARRSGLVSARAVHVIPCARLSDAVATA